MRKKQILSLMVAVLFVFTFVAGCGSKAPESQSGDNKPKTEEKKKFKIGFSNASVSNTWRVGMYNSVVDEIKKHPEFELLYADANDNAAKQTGDVEDLLTKGIDLLLISPATTDALNPAIEKAFDSGIPVVVFDRFASTPKITTFVETSNYDCGIKAAEKTVALLKEKYGTEKGNVVIIEGFPGAGATVERQQGIMDVFKKYPNIKVVADQPADFQRAKGLAVMENVLQAQPKIDVVLSHSGESLVGAYQAVENAGRTKEMKFVGIDGYNGLLKLIKDGKVDYTVLFPVSLGAEAVKVAAKVLNGEEVPKKWSMPLIEVTKDNVDKYVDMNADDSAWTY